MGPWTSRVWARDFLGGRATFCFPTVMSPCVRERPKEAKGTRVSFTKRKFALLHTDPGEAAGAAPQGVRPVLAQHPLQQRRPPPHLRSDTGRP